ncbi:hypothetical protein [Listeria costaricensis]|uniref:hypothetical protein n=1 Tax=Listeria costaricensis TaxID=2026604 RepID=UPI000C08936B|nr:hypothetical protein [Listeria costaricensis]
MREWTIQTKSRKFVLAVDKVTQLYGELQDWREIIDALEAFFSRKSPDIVIFEGNQVMVQQDYEFYYIDRNFDLKKLLKGREERFLDELMLSPIYRDFVESWEMLQEEVSFLGKEKYQELLQLIDLRNFEKNDLRRFLQFKHEQTDMIRQLVLQGDIHKKQIFVLDIANKWMNEVELSKFILETQKRGILVFLVGKVEIEGTISNVFYQQSIINRIKMENVYEKVQENIPVYYQEEDWETAKNWSIRAVDNFGDEGVILTLFSVDNLAVFLLVYFIFIFCEWPLTVDFQGVSVDMRKYIDSIVVDRV